jgi:hypothetical protein
MDRIMCEWCHEQNPPDRIDCVKCGAPLDVRDRLSNQRPSYMGQIFASGPRVWGWLKGWAPTGRTPRSALWNPSFRPELLDAPIYDLTVELWLPNGAAISAKYGQPVPLNQVPNLIPGLQLVCVVHPDPATKIFIVDWSIPPIPPPVPPRSTRWGRRSAQ